SRRQWDGSGDSEPGLQRARELARRLDDPTLEGFAVYHLAMAATERGAIEQGRQRFSEALDIHAATRAPLGMGLALEGLAVLSTWVGDHEASLALHGRALASHRAAGNRRWEAISLRNRAFVHHQRGD